MVAGGYYGQILTTAQLFNWATKESCFVHNLPYQVSSPAMTDHYGVPVMCGGSRPSSMRITCYKLNPADNSWIQVRAPYIFSF